jgi:hypothetical protein
MKPRPKKVRNLTPGTAVYRGLDFSAITDKKFDMIVRKLGKSRSKTLNEIILGAEK